MIPFLVTNAPLHTTLVSGLIIALTSLLATAAVLLLTITLRAGQRLYVLSLLLLLPCTALSIALPLIHTSATLPFLQGFLFTPLLLLPVSLPIRTLQPSWSATAQELGADTVARFRFFWWPLLQNPLALTLFLSLLCSIVQ